MAFLTQLAAPCIGPLLYKLAIVQLSVTRLYDSVPLGAELQVFPLLRFTCPIVMYISSRAVADADVGKIWPYRSYRYDIG
jgi:hypothetical protein